MFPLFVSPAHYKCNHQYLSHSAASHRGIFVTPVSPDSQSAALGCAAVMNLHFCGLFSVLYSWFVAGKLRHRAAGACSLYLWWGVGAVTEGQECWGCSQTLLTTSSVWCCSISSVPCHLLAFKCKETRLILNFVHGSCFPTCFFLFAEEIEKKLNIYRKGCKIWKMLIFCQVHESC